ncbi:hypothetical protein ACH4TV_05665 [Streptomyces sp. NPDC020898]|uniref:hypothetical protein n=1 Tax=Streptomyces sp. NPDC020898 TaxID=3365101 RepID=UPI00378B5E3D
MFTVPAVPTRLTLGPGWETVQESGGRVAADLRVRRGGGNGVTVDVRLERCVSGRLRDTYPVGAHDVEVRIGAGCPQDVRPALLRAVREAVQAADPRCRRVVHAVPVGEGEWTAAAESAGFRYAVDVDLGLEQLGLLVAEPDWVTGPDLDLDRVPGA